MKKTTRWFRFPLDERLIIFRMNWFTFFSEVMWSSFCDNAFLPKVIIYNVVYDAPKQEVGKRSFIVRCQTCNFTDKRRERERNYMQKKLKRTRITPTILSALVFFHYDHISESCELISKEIRPNFVKFISCSNAVGCEHVHDYIFCLFLAVAVVFIFVSNLSCISSSLDLSTGYASLQREY